MTLRAKLALVVGVGAVALIVLVVTSALVERRVDRQLASIQGHYLPRIGLAPRLTSGFDQIGRDLQDAATAGDEEALDQARHAKDALIAAIDGAGDAIAAGEAAPLRAAIADYYAAADALSRRLVAGESAASMVDAAQAMQVKLEHARDLLERATRFDERELTRAFAAAGDAHRTGTRIRLIASLVCVAAIVLLAFWIARGVSRNVSRLNDGFARFGDGKFDTRIALDGSDELSQVAAAANQMAARLRLLDDAAGELRRGLEQQADELRRASAYKSQFLAGMSHELRTPLNAIIGFSEVMHDGMVPAVSDQHKEFLGYILTSGRHLLQLINDVLDLSKVEAGKLEFHPDAIALDVVVREVVGMLRSSLSDKRLTISDDIDPAVNALVLDPARLKQVLYNYLSNAIKFTAAGGKIAVRARRDRDGAGGDDRVRIEVEDTGAGIAPHDLKRLFSDFEQLGGSVEKAGGTGLGLALTRRLVEAQGGTVGVTSELGKGSTFHAVLPRSAGGARDVRPTVDVAPGNAARVLVIEDNLDERVELASALGASGYHVEVAASGRQALARAAEQCFDAITLDLLLPDMSGLEVLRKLSGDARHANVPVVVLTVVAERGAVAGFAVSDILAKPIDGDALCAALVRAGVPPNRSRTVLVVDDDPASLQLMSSMLDQLGYRSRCELDAAAALDGLAELRPTAIVLDLLMPGMSGFEFLDRLRGRPTVGDVPVIVWTSKDLSSDEHARLRASANAIVSKGRGGSAGVIAELASHLAPRRG